MSVTYTDVVQEQVTASAVTIYTASSATDFESAHIIFGNCTNESGTDTTLQINIVQSGGSAAVTNHYLPPTTIFAGRSNSLTPLMGVVLKAGDFISSIGGAGSNLNLKLTVKEIYSDA